MAMSRRVLATSAAVVLVAAGCRGGGTTQDNPPVPSSSAEAAPSAASSPADQSGPPYTAEFPWGTFKLSPRLADKLKNKEAFNIALSIEATGAPVFAPLYKAGFTKSLTDPKNTDRWPFQAQFIGPPSTDQQAQVAQVDALFNSDQLDCLAIEMGGPEAYINEINKLVEAGIPVFTDGNDAPRSKRFETYYPGDEKDNTKKITDVALKYFKDNGVTLSKVAAMSGSPTEPFAVARLGAFYDQVKAEVPGVTFLPDSPDQVTKDTFDPAPTYAHAKTLLDANPDLQLIFQTDLGAEQVAKAIVDSGRSGKTWVIGYAYSPAVLDYIESGEILATISQNWDLQGAHAVDACLSFLVDGKVLPNDLPGTLVTKDNLEEARTNLTEALGTP